VFGLQREEAAWRISEVRLPFSYRRCSDCEFCPIGNPAFALPQPALWSCRGYAAPQNRR